jgi:Flp pilus assembly protein TadG
MTKLRAAILAFASARHRELLRRFRRDQSGGYLVIAGLMMPVFVGLVGLGTDATLWLYKHRAMQSAADSSAFSAATAYINNTKTQAGLASQAKAVAGSYGFVDGTNNVGVSVTWPYDSRQGSVEVMVQQPQTPIFAALFVKDVMISAHAVALGTPQQAGTGCVVALNTSASGAVTSQGSSRVVLDQCSLASNSTSSSALTIGGSAQITALSVSVKGGISGPTSQIITPPGGITTGSSIADPYAGISYPPVPNRCDKTGFVSKTTETVAPARQAGDPSAPVPPLYVLCGGMTLNAGANVTLNPGIYYLVESDQNHPGVLSVQGGATLTGSGVTLVFTSRDGRTYGTTKINGGATINLTAPTSGATAGIVIFGDRNMPVSTSFQFNGGASQIFNGAIYVPKGTVTFAGGSGTSNACTQLVADTVTFTGNSNFKIGCANGMQEIGSIPASVKLIQ